MRFKLNDLPPVLRKQALNQVSSIPVYSGVRNPVNKQDDSVRALGQKKNEERGAGRFKVSIERRGAKLLDPDNLFGSAKFICDALRYESIIPDDNPLAIDLVVTQKVTDKKNRGTMITVERLSNPPSAPKRPLL